MTLVNSKNLCFELTLTKVGLQDLLDFSSHQHHPMETNDQIGDSAYPSQ